MSDEANAPSNGASAPVASEAPLQPVTAPAAAPESVADKPATSAREAVERALAKVGAPEGEKPADGRTRDEAGKFTKAADKPVDTTAKPADAGTIEAPKPTVIAQPAPSGFTKAAQDAWAQTPEPVRLDTERRITELTQGLEKYKTELTAFEPVRKYDEMARQSGTTLDQALANYVGIENAIHADPIAGIVQVCRNVGLDPRAVGAALANLQNLPHVQPQQQRESPEVAALKRELAQIKEQIGGVTSTISQTQAQTTIDKFAADPSHPYFDDLSDSIANMLETKFAKDLPDAYQKAVLLNPEIAAKIAAEKAAKAAPQPDPAQTRQKASLSPTGTPSVGSTPSTRQPAGSAREALTNAFASVGL